MRPAYLLLGLVAGPPAFAARPCGACHPKQVSGYERTAMARSLARAAPQPAGSFTHTYSGSRFTIRLAGPRMFQRVERNGIAAEHPIGYVIGSGSHAFGYLVQAGDALFQSPVSYYTNRRLWDVAPGY